MLWYDKGTSFAFRACSAEKNRRRGGREQEKAGTQMPAQVAMGRWLVLVPPYSCRAAGQRGMEELSGTGTDAALWCCFAAVVHGGAWGPKWWWVVQGRGQSWYFCFYWGRGRVVGVGKQIRRGGELLGLSPCIAAGFYSPEPVFSTLCGDGVVESELWH